jgi:hypothetical protein
MRGSAASRTARRTSMFVGMAIAVWLGLIRVVIKGDKDEDMEERSAMAETETSGNSE